MVVWKILMFEGANDSNLVYVPVGIAVEGLMGSLPDEGEGFTSETIKKRRR